LEGYLDSTKNQYNSVWLMLGVEGIDDEGLVVETTRTIDGEDDAGYVGAEVVLTPPDQDIPSGFPVDANVIVVTASPRSDYKYDHTNIKIDLSFISSEALKTIKVHGFTPSVRRLFTRADILARAPTMKALDDAQRATQMCAEDLSAAMGQLSTHLSATARGLSAIRNVISPSTPKSLMLVWPDLWGKDDVRLID